MKMNRPSKWKVLLTVLVFSGALVLAEARKADAFVDPLTVGAAIVVGAVAIVGTYAAVMTTVCTPVAAIKASDHSGGFGGAFGDCFHWRSSSSPQAAAPEQVGMQPSDGTNQVTLGDLD